MPGPISSSAAKTSLDAIKSDVCDTTLVVISLLALPGLSFSVLRTVDSGWSVQYTGQAIAVALFWAIALFRRRLPYHLRAGAILLLLFGLGWSGQVFSASSTSYAFFVSVSAMAAVFYGSAFGIAAVAICAASILATYLAMQAGVLAAPPATSTLALSAWLSRIASMVGACAGPVIAVTEFSKSLLRELKRAEAASEAKSAFLATMSHELRTPMTAIIGTAELLQDDTLNPDQARKVGRITRSGKNLLSLLNDLLDFAKIEAEQMPVDRVPFTLNEILLEVRELFSPLANEKGVVLRVEPLAADPSYLGDPARVRQILSNLIGNAVKFTREGEVVISASDEEFTADSALVRIAVSDTGIGISANDQARLFQPFVQAESFRSRREGGTGLGLTISRRLAALMGGDISLVSTPGRGSTFTLTLPLDRAPRLPAPRPEAGVISTAGVRLSLLVAEDNEAIRELMSEMLTRRGHDVTAVGDGHAALDAVRLHQFDAVVMDMHMPVMDGAEATRAIRALGGKAAQVPIIALTAGLTEDQRRAYLDAGVNVVAAKPANWPVLFDAIESGGGAVRTAPEQQASAPDSYIDADHLADLASALGPDAIRAALESFHEAVRRCVADVTAAVAAGDLVSARRAAHSLKGAALQFGALEIARLAAAVESAGATLADMTRITAQMPAAAGRFKAAAEGL